MTISIGSILSRSWNMVSQNRVFWLLGLALSLVSSSFNFQIGRPTVVPGTAQSPADINAYLTASGGALAASGCLAAVIAIVFFILRPAFEAALISASDQTLYGRAPTFSEAFAAGRARMWRVLGLNLILLAIALVLVGLLVVVILAVGGAAVASLFGALASSSQRSASDVSGFGAAFCGALACLCGGLLLAVPVLAVLTIVVQLGERAVVLDNQGVGQAWSSGWRLFRAFLGPILLLVLSMIGIGLVFSIGIGLIGTVVTLPVTFALAGNGPDGALGTILGFVAGLLLWLVTGVLGAIPAAWASTALTLLYRDITASASAASGQAAILAGPPSPYGVAPGGTYNPANPYGSPGASYSPPNPPYRQPGGGYPAPDSYGGGYTTPGAYPGAYVPPSPPDPGTRPSGGASPPEAPGPGDR